MTTVLLLRHGRTTANAEGILAGWAPGVHLDEVGREQVEAAAGRLADVRITAVVTSPLDRCRETTEAITRRRRKDLPMHTEVDLAECRYGDWTGESLEILAKDPLWEVIQHHPSGVTFPGGESMVEMQARAISSIRRWNRRLGDSSAYVAVTHGDVIKAVVADALGMHLDLFQRIRIDPGSISVIEYYPTGVRVARVNDQGGDLSMFTPGRKTGHSAAPHGVVGGETGA